MPLDIFQVDAFAKELFQGNSAAVVPLTEMLDADLMQKIAMANALPETAFIVPLADPGHFTIRQAHGDPELNFPSWFTPNKEIALCGHATLAAAFIIFTELKCEEDLLNLHSTLVHPCSDNANRLVQGAGVLQVRRGESGLTMFFPSEPGTPVPEADAVQVRQALGLGMEAAQPCKVETESATATVLACPRNYLVILPDEHALLSLKPILDKVSALAPEHMVGVIATAKCESGADVVSRWSLVRVSSNTTRYFAPRYGVPEDPVTGSAHCSLVPYWLQTLSKDSVQCKQVTHSERKTPTWRQVSVTHGRTGYLDCSLVGDKVTMTGQSILYLRGTIVV